MKKKEENKPGKLSASEIANLVNKKAGKKLLHDLSKEDPAKVEQWIPTGSTWLDCTIARGIKAGIPVGRITELAGDASTGKSYMAAQIAANAQKMGIMPVYFDSESAMTKEFLQKAGCETDNDSMLYVPTTSVEQVMETMETMLQASSQQFLFIWDSVAFTPTVSDVEGDFNPQSSMAVKPRILSKAISKLSGPLRDSQSTWLCLNQLKTNIGAQGLHLTDSQKWFTPGGKALVYAYSLRIWLNRSRSKNLIPTDDRGFQVGSFVKCRLEKDRFGGENRTCEFKISWGDEVRVMDEESWLTAISNSPSTKLGSWNSIVYEDGTESEKFRKDDFVKMMEKSEKFKNRVLQLMEEEQVTKFAERTADAKNYYDDEDNEKLPEEVIP